MTTDSVSRYVHGNDCIQERFVDHEQLAALLADAYDYSEPTDFDYALAERTRALLDPAVGNTLETIGGRRAGLAVLQDVQSARPDRAVVPDRHDHARGQPPDGRLPAHCP